MSAQEKIRQLVALLPVEVQDSAYFIPDGPYVWLKFTDPVPPHCEEEIHNFVKANQGYLSKEEVRGELMYQFPVDHPTCHQNGTPTITTTAIPTTTTASSTIVTTPITSVSTVSGVAVEIKNSEKSSSLPVPSTSVSKIEKEDKYKTPIERIRENEKNLQQLQPKHLTPLGDYDGVFCSTCININTGPTPCNEFEKCAIAKQTLLLHKNVILQQKTIDLLNELLQKYLPLETQPTQQQPQQQSQQEQNSLTQTQIEQLNKQPQQTLTPATIPTSSPATSVVSTPKPTQQPPLQQQNNSQNNNNNNSNGGKRFENGVCWTDAVTDKGDYCQRAYEKNNFTNNKALTPEYVKLLTKFGNKDSIFADGYFYWNYDEGSNYWNLNVGRYVGRKKCKDSKNKGGKGN